MSSGAEGLIIFFIFPIPIFLGSIPLVLFIKKDRRLTSLITKSTLILLMIIFLLFSFSPPTVTQGNFVVNPDDQYGNLYYTPMVNIFSVDYFSADVEIDITSGFFATIKNGDIFYGRHYPLSSTETNKFHFSGSSGPLAISLPSYEEYIRLEYGYRYEILFLFGIMKNSGNSFNLSYEDESEITSGSIINHVVLLDEDSSELVYVDIPVFVSGTYTITDNTPLFIPRFFFSLVGILITLFVLIPILLFTVFPLMIIYTKRIFDPIRRRRSIKSQAERWNENIKLRTQKFLNDPYDYKFCRNCGSRGNITNKFCKSCGTKYHELP